MKLDLGCGAGKREGFIGVDVKQSPGVDVVCDLGKDPWPWADGVVEEAHCSHMLEHLEPLERIHFANELGRVMKKGGQVTLVVPHWASGRAYGDLSHKWPPVSEFWFLYLNAEWRAREAQHEDRYTCDFNHTQPGYSPHPSLAVRSFDHQQYALIWFKEAAQDMMVTLIKK